jgi:hypothetical protein
MHVVLGAHAPVVGVAITRICLARGSTYEHGPSRNLGFAGLTAGGGSLERTRLRSPTAKWTLSPRLAYLNDCYYAYFSDAGIAAAADFAVYQRKRRYLSDCYYAYFSSAGICRGG